MSYCLIPKLADKFKKMLISGEINPEKLNAMTSEGRRKFFSSVLGEENAKSVNSLFEQKLLLKNQQTAMISWAKTVAGIKPEIRRDLISRIERMDARVLNPADQESFLADLARTKIGTEVTFEEAKIINDFSQAVSATKDKLSLNPNDPQLREDYGMSLIKMNEYLNSVSPSKDNIILSVANLPRALMSSMDLSAPFRQGFGMVTTPEFWKNIGPMVKYWNKINYDKMQAMVLADPYHEMATRAGLKVFNLTGDLRLREEAFMTTLVDKIPGLNASERAYTGFLTKLRFDRFKTLVKQAELAGEDVRVGSEAVKQIAHMVNNFTGAGSVDKFEPAIPWLNSVFFSPRKVMSNIQMLNPATYLNPKTSPTARKAALKQLIGMVSVASGLIGMASVAGYKQETDPTSSDFGKVKIGNTRFDVTGGNASMAILLARLVSGQTTSTTSGISKDLGAGFNQTSRGDIMVQFLKNKLSPTASFVSDWMFGKNAIGEPFSITEEVKSRMMPMIIGDMMDISMSDPSMAFPVFAADLFGFGVQTYTADVTWTNNPGKELAQFQKKVGDVKFVEANNTYNNQVSDKMEALSNDEKYNALSDAERLKVVTKEKGIIKNKVLSSYGFKYKAPK